MVISEFPQLLGRTGASPNAAFSVGPNKTDDNALRDVSLGYSHIPNIF